MRYSRTHGSWLLVGTLLSTSSACYSGLDAADSADPGPGMGSAGEPPSEDDDDDESPGPSEVPEDGELLPISMVRLSASRYRNTIADLFSAQIADALALDEIPESSGWSSIGARDVVLSIDNVVAYERAALQVASAAVVDPTWRSRWAPCEPTEVVDTACMNEILEGFGGHLFRRPLDDNERARYVAVAIAAAEDAQDFWGGLRYALTGMLISPRFTHLVEIGEPRGEYFAYTDFELASRLSYLLWDTTPDDGLLAAASAGRLSTPEGLEEQFDRMVADTERVAQGIRAFSYDLLQLRSLDHSLVDTSVFPGFTEAVRESLEEGTLMMMVDMALHDEREFLAVLESGFTYADGALAEYYDELGPEAVMQRIELQADSLRVGLLTEPSLLAATSGSAATSPTRRGRFIFSRLLCAEIPPPPPDVANDLPAPPEGTTRREQLQQHMEEPACASCHQFMDPLGFALEHFDPVGRIQLTDGGKPIDASGTIDGVAFDGARSLSEALLQHEELRGCFARHVYSYVTGAAPAAEYRWIIDGVEQDYAESGGDVIAIWRSLVLSDAFRFGHRAREEVMLEPSAEGE
ncbi:MAG: DUF1592 domain-containing protein [Myxococcota bacterium]